MVSEALQFEFGPFRFDLRNVTLWDCTQEIHLSPKAFNVLYYLLQHAGQLVTKDFLLKAIWNDRVGEEALKIQVSNIRKALQDNPKYPVYIMTVPKHGYRFIGNVRSANSSSSEEENQPVYRSHYFPLQKIFWICVGLG